MFDIGWSELLVIGIVALIVIGPKELPATLRTVGQWMGKIRRMAGEFQDQVREAMREAELADLKKDMDDMAAKATSYGQLDPLEDVRKDLEKAVELPPLDEQSTAGTAHAGATTPDTPAAEPAPPGEPAAPPAAEPAPGQPEPVLADGKPDAGRAPA